MGRFLRPGTDACHDFKPDDTDTLLHISCEFASPSFQTIIDRAKEKWPDASFDNISVEAKHIHSYALGYDRYDPGDYVDYIVLELKK